MDHLRYEIDIFWSDEDGGYIANVPDLKYCSAFGKTYEEALQEVKEAIDLHLDVLKEMGRPSPEPGALREDEAAEKLADAVRESYQMVADRAVSARELNAELTENFFNRVINNLRTQAEQNREITQQLADQQERQREATQALTQESVGAYMDFINNMLSYYQGVLEETKKQA